jgi:hypothetical protein
MDCPQSWLLIEQRIKDNDAWIRDPNNAWINQLYDPLHAGP